MLFALPTGRDDLQAARVTPMYTDQLSEKATADSITYGAVAEIWDTPHELGLACEPYPKRMSGR
jgi:hypothetical protein